jgi:Bacterial extracellular solute-binding proteins, family 5 Middle
VSKTDSAPTKWGTLIEWVTHDISFVPYTSFTPQDRFYQHLLFPGCLAMGVSGGVATYDTNICKVLSTDYKTYIVSLNTTGTWSDGAPVSLTDVLYTYENILQKNTRWLPFRQQYEGLSIQKISPTSFSVTFPRSSKDNTQFFTYPILPSHILEKKSREEYTKLFASKPVTAWCASINNSRDTQSVIFDVGNCRDTWLKYYQVKNISPEQLEKDPGIIDLALWGETVLPDYSTGTLITNDYMWLFFNMQKGKLNIYGRKNMIALVTKYLYLAENDVSLIEEHFLFDTIPQKFSDPSTISSIWSGYAIALPPVLPTEITIKQENQLFTMPQDTTEVEVHLSFPGITPAKAFTNAGVSIPLIKERGGRSMRLTPGKNIFDWHSTITFVNKDMTVIGSISILHKLTSAIDPAHAIHILYYMQDPLQSHIMTVVRNSLIEAGLIGYVVFDGAPTPKAFRESLAAGTYDMTLQTLALWVKKDISTMFLSDDPLQNPSLYVNANLASQINDYFQSPLQAQYNIKPLINKLYSNDLPFVILGKRRGIIYFKPSLKIPSDHRYDEETVRQDIFSSTVVVSKPQVTKKDILNRKKFGQFILSEIGF